MTIWMRSFVYAAIKPLHPTGNGVYRIPRRSQLSPRYLNSIASRWFASAPNPEKVQSQTTPASRSAASNARKYVSTLNVSEAFDKVVSEHASKTAYIFSDGIEKTFGQFHDDVAAFAGGLKQLGVSPHARVAIFAPTCYEWLIAKYAINRAGCVAVALNLGAHKEELGYVLEKTGTEVIIIGDTFKYMDYYKTLCEVYPELCSTNALDAKRTLKHIVSISTQRKPGTILFRELQSSAPVQDAGMKSDDPAVIIQSSGSTGKPKSIVLSHGNVVSVAYQTFPAVRLRPSSIVLASLPLYHSFGYLCIEANNTLNGLTTVFTSAKPKPSEILDMVERYRVTTLHGTPTTFYDIFHCADFAQRDLSSIENATIGATTLHKSVIKNVIEKLRLKNLMLGYGLTETSGACSYADGKEFRGYVPFPGTEFRLGSPDESVTVDGQGIQGEVQIRGSTLFQEYLNDEEKTRQAFTDDGWFRTGDMGFLNDDGFLEIRDRASDLIIKGGVNISPTEIEKALLEHPTVAEAQVIGVFDERLGEEICAWIKLQSGGYLTTDMMTRHCTSKLANIKIPKYYVFTEDFPRTSVGKVSKKLLREVFEKECSQG